MEDDFVFVGLPANVPPLLLRWQPMNDHTIIVEGPDHLSVADDIDPGSGDLPLDARLGQSKAASDQSDRVKPNQSESK